MRARRRRVACLRPLQLVAGREEDAVPAPGHDRGEFLGQPRLTDAWLAREEHDPTAPGLGARPRVSQRGEFTLTTNERPASIGGRRGRRPDGRRLGGLSQQLLV